MLIRFVCVERERSLRKRAAGFSRLSGLSSCMHSLGCQTRVKTKRDVLIDGLGNFEISLLETTEELQEKPRHAPETASR